MTGGAVNYVNCFDDVDVAASVGYVFGSDEVNTAATDNRDTIQGALVVGFSGFSVGGSIAQDNNGLAGDDETLTWDIGATYSTGPWTVGVTYLRCEAETGSGSPDVELDGFVVSGTSNLAPGVDLWAGVKYQDYQSGANDPASENEALFDMIGTSVSFYADHRSEPTSCGAGSRARPFLLRWFEQRLRNVG